MKPRVLVIDDDASFLVSCATLLTDEFTVECAQTGGEGLALLNHETAVLLLDWLMPGMSGMEVLLAAKERAPSSIIVLTAVNDVGTAVDAMKAGAYDYITKPFDIDDLLNRVWTAALNQQDRSPHGMVSLPTYTGIRHLQLNLGDTININEGEFFLHRCARCGNVWRTKNASPERCGFRKCQQAPWRHLSRNIKRLVGSDRQEAAQLLRHLSSS